MQEPESPRHLSFLLRLWQAVDAGRTNWQASLEIPGTGKRLGFANLERLFAYLVQMTEGDPANSSDQSQPEL
ncbi:MAG TPA: hypothetical protein VF784_00695 [Anaerolineales bacterium]